ncbi:MAG: ABC transporter permease [Candidatus Bathyarchaeia archaeon]
MNKLSPILAAVGAFTLILLALPTIIVVSTSFTETRMVAFPPRGFTLKWYLELLSTEWFIKTFMNSLYAAAICTTLSIPVGVAAALALNKYRVRGSNGIQIYLLLPFTVPLIVSGISLLFIYVRLGWLGRIAPIGFALMVINIPFMIWSVSASVNSLDPNLEYAAQNLGAEEVQTFLYVTVPSLLPGIISGALLMFILGLTEFITSMILVTLSNMTLPVALYNSIKTYLTPMLSSASTIYIIIAVFTVWLVDRIIGLEEYMKII